MDNEKVGTVLAAVAPGTKRCSAGTAEHRFMDVATGSMGRAGASGAVPGPR